MIRDIVWIETGTLMVMALTNGWKIQSFYTENVHWLVFKSLIFLPLPPQLRNNLNFVTDFDMSKGGKYIRDAKVIYRYACFYFHPSHIWSIPNMFTQTLVSGTLGRISFPRLSGEDHPNTFDKDVFIGQLLSKK